MRKNRRKTRVGVVGAGHLGSKHARVYYQLKNADLAYVCDSDKKIARKIARKYRARWCTDYRDLFDKVEAVSIVTPTGLHYKIAKDFLESGTHVLIEKPITKTLAEADELIRIAEQKNLLIQVGHVERFNSAVMAIAPLLTQPRFIECHRVGSYTDKKKIQDVGVVLDLMIHDIDIILSLVNSEVKNIEAVGVSSISDHEDIANVRLTFKNNAIADITASRVTKEKARKIKISQEDSYISLDYMRQDACIFRKEGNRIKKRKIKIKKKEPLKAELKSFVNCVQSLKKPIVSGYEGRRALGVALNIVDRINKGSSR